MVPVLAGELQRKRFLAVREFNFRVGSPMYRRALKEGCAWRSEKELAERSSTCYELG